MLIETSKAAEFGCHVTRAWPPDTPEKTPGRMCAGRRCSAWVVLWSPRQVTFFDSLTTRPGRYRAAVEIGACGLLPRSLGDSETDVPAMELRARLAELTEAGVLTFEPSPPKQRGGTVLSRPGDAI